MATLRPHLLLALAPLLAACRSTDGWRAHADEEVYGILEARRAELGAKEPFTIEPPANPLRDQLLAASAAGEPRELTLDLVGCLRVAAENSREWQDERELLFRAALALTRARWEFSVKETATAEYTAAGVPGGGPVPPETERGLVSDFGLLKLLGIGTELVGNVSLDLLESLGTGDVWSAFSSLSLNITQPILRGFGRDIVEEPLTQAERDVLYQARRYERFRRTFAVDVAQRFFQVLEQFDRLRNEEANYDNLTRLRERNEAMAEAGRMDDIQLGQSRQDELSAQDSVVAVRRDLEAALDDLKFALGLPLDTRLTLDEGGLRSLEAWPALSQDLDEVRVVRLGLENRLDHAVVRDQAEDARRRVHVTADALRTGLELAGGAGVVSPADEPGSLALDDVAWDLRLSLDLPLDRIPERNAYRSAMIDYQASQRAVEASADRVTSDLRDALRRLEAARASYKIQSGSTVLAERRVENAELQLEAGRASTRDYLESQESLLTSQNTLAAALTDTILAGLFLYRDMELLEVTDQGIEVLLLEPEEPPSEVPEAKTPETDTAEPREEP